MDDRSDESNGPAVVGVDRMRGEGTSASRDRTPYTAYGTILVGFAGALAATAAAERSLGRENRAPTTLDYVLLCGSSFKAARVLSRERVGSVLRQPFVEPTDAAPAETANAVEERPAGDGLRRAVGELVTCTRCAGTWAAAVLLASQALAPRFGRLLTWALAAGAANDFLQAGFAAVRAREIRGTDSRDDGIAS
jgi:hypothetical protein